MPPTLTAAIEFNPTPEEASGLQEKFGLSYHVPFAAKAAHEIGLAGKRVLEVGGSLPPEFVRECLGAAQWTAVEELGYWRVVNQVERDTTAVLSQPYVKHLAEATAADVGGMDYLLLDGAIEDAPPTLDGQFDAAFSIACFEHVSRLPKALSAIHRLLKPGGKLFTLFSPIWSAHDGHHLPAITDASGRTFYFGKNNPIPPWGHLLAGPSAMYQHLLGVTDAKAAEEIVYYVYHAPHISRLFTEDYKRYFDLSPFQAVTCLPAFRIQMPPEMQAQLERLHPDKKHFSNNGVLGILQK